MRIALILICFFFASNLFAQADSVKIVSDSSKALKKSTANFFVQFEGEGAYIFKQAAMISGASINLLLNKKFYVGAKYSIASTPIRTAVYNFDETIDPLNPNSRVYYQSATINFGYILFHDKKISFNPELGLGWGEIRKPADSNGGIVKLNHGVALPSLNALWNAHKNFRLGVTAGGRIAYGQNFQLLQSFHASGFYGGVFFRIGRF
jgi:hypothetical protein